jgi:probable phosphoglycerate mutase
LGQIIFLRHGQAKNNTERILAGRTEGVPLTELGIKQAEQTAELLKHMNISAIYSSPIERAKHTAEIAGKHNSLDVTIDDRLIELDMGKFTGMPYDEIFKSHGNVFMKFYNGELEIAHNGVETFPDVKKRILGIVDHVIEKHPDENVLLVTHMDPIKAMLSTVIDLSPTNLFELIIANASLNIFREKDRKFSISGLNVMHPSRFDQGW